MNRITHPQSRLVLSRTPGPAQTFLFGALSGRGTYTLCPAADLVPSNGQSPLAGGRKSNASPQERLLADTRSAHPLVSRSVPDESKRRTQGYWWQGIPAYKTHERSRQRDNGGCSDRRRQQQNPLDGPRR